MPAPRLNANSPYPGEISNDKGINPVVFVKGIKGFFILCHFLGIEAVDLRGEGCQPFTGGKVIGDMYAVKAGGFQTDDKRAELMVQLQDLGNHLLHLLCAVLCVWDGNHAYEEVLLEIQSRDNV